jgi:hypothetical protein
LARYDATDGSIVTEKRAQGQPRQAEYPVLSQVKLSEYMPMDATSYSVPMCNSYTSLT